MLTSWSLLSLAAVGTAQAYFLMGLNNVLTTERIDPIVNQGTVSTHVHTVFGGSNFRMTTNTSYLRQSECTSVPIQEDHSNYWVPTMYFQWKNGSVTSVNGGAVVCTSPDYLYDGKVGSTKAFPEDFRMISGDPMLRTYDATSFAQQAITFLCLDFQGKTTKHNELPSKLCPSGIRAQVNFPSCWDGKNVDSADHKSHVAYLSQGPDSGDCSDPNFPVKLPRVFMEMYWASADFKDHVQDAMTPDQPFVFAQGDRTGYGYHGDFFNGWKDGVLQKVVDECDCDPNGSLDCCAAKGIFTLDKQSKCQLTKAIDEPTLGTLPKLPGNNPIQEAGTRAKSFPDTTNPNRLEPVYVYRGDKPDKVGTPSGSAASGGVSSGSDSNDGDQTPPNGGQQTGNKPPTSGSDSGSNPTGDNSDGSHDTDNSNTGTGTGNTDGGNSNNEGSHGTDNSNTGTGIDEGSSNNDGSQDTDNSNTGTGTGTGTGNTDGGNSNNEGSHGTDNSNTGTGTDEGSSNNDGSQDTDNSNTGTGTGNTDGGSSNNGQSTPPTSSSPASPPPTPPPTSGSNDGNKGSEGSNGGNSQSPPSNPPTSGSSSGGTSNSSSQQSSSGSRPKSCKRNVRKRFSKGKRHGNSIRKRFHSTDF